MLGIGLTQKAQNRLNDECLGSSKTKKLGLRQIWLIVHVNETGDRKKLTTVVEIEASCRSCTFTRDLRFDILEILRHQ